MYNKLVSIENLFASWDGFKRGKIKKPDVLVFERNLEDNIFALQAELISQTYQHGPYTTFHINDPKPRIINKANVRDRLVHHAMFAELYRLFDPIFIYHSYSSRVGKGTHLAVKNLTQALRQVSRNYTVPVFALKCDIKKFFQNLSHPKLLELIQRRVKDKKCLWLIEEIVASFATPLGGVAILVVSKKGGACRLAI